MIAALVLVSYAAVMGTMGAATLTRSSWTTRAPRLGIALWQAASVSTLSAAVLAALTFALRLSVLNADVAALLHTCLTNVRTGYATPGGSVTTTLGLAAAVLITGRATWCVLDAVVRQRRELARQLQVVGVLARRDPERGFLVVPHETATAFCLAGRGDGVVLTTAALAVLRPEELTAVVAHERAHLRGRHHLLVAASHGLARAFPGVLVFAEAEKRIAELIEMAADDAARQRSHPAALAHALLAVTSGPTPRAALAAANRSVEVRVLRLLSPFAPLGSGQRLLITAVLTLLLATPIAIAAAPAILATQADYCLIGRAL